MNQAERSIPMSDTESISYREFNFVYHSVKLALTMVWRMVDALRRHSTLFERAAMSSLISMASLYRLDRMARKLEGILQEALVEVGELRKVLASKWIDFPAGQEEEVDNG